MINYSFVDTLAVTKHLFPDLINYATIDEYKEPIYELLESLVKNKIVKPRRYKKYKKQLLTEAKIELKRQLSKKVDAKNYDGYYSSDKYSENDILNTYTKLLLPFSDDKHVADFLSKLKLTNNYYVKSTLVASKLKKGERVSLKLIKEMAEDLSSSAVLYKKLSKIKKTNLFPKKYSNREWLFKSVLVESGAFKEKKDSIVFIDKKDFKIGKKRYEAYFYKDRKIDLSDTYDKEWKLNYVAFEKEKDDELTLANEHNYETSLKLDETKEIEKILSIEIEKMVLKKRKRVNLSENNYYY